MNELLSQLWTPELQSAFTVVVVFLVVLYVLSIVWVVRDSYLRGSFWYIWAIVALVPLVGVIAYSLLRPPLLQIDRDEQELEVALKQRELMKYGECANCGYPVESDFVLCPNCHQRLKNLCTGCNRALDPAWTLCPYCATPVPGMQPARRAPHPSARQLQTPQQQPPARPAERQEQRQAERRARPAARQERRAADEAPAPGVQRSAEPKAAPGSMRSPESKAAPAGKRAAEPKAASGGRGGTAPKGTASRQQGQPSRTRQTRPSDKGAR